MAAFPQACTRKTGLKHRKKPKHLKHRPDSVVLLKSTWIHKTKNRVSDEKDSWRTHWGQKAEFCNALHNLVHTFIPIKFHLQKQLWKKNGKSLSQFQHGTAEKKREQWRGHDRGTENNKKVHFASLMYLCHLKNSELEPQFQKCKGRVVLRGDIVKDDSGAYAVFTEQGWPQK